MFEFDQNKWSFHGMAYVGLINHIGLWHAQLILKVLK
jgi:hypothetical protein